MLTAAAVGFATAFPLIFAIGAQNAFVLRQGLMRAHVLPLVLLCAGSDTVLILAGVAGFGALSGRLPWLPDAMALAGAAFLTVYGIGRFRAARRGEYAMELAGRPGAFWPTLMTGAAFTWLNPHVYLYTVGLIGAVSTAYPGPERWAFAAGASAASISFFLSLGFGAARLAPVMRSPRAWARLDLGVGVTMLVLAAGLILHSRA